MDMQIDFLYLDLETCTRCRATDRNLEAALEATRDVLAMNAIAVGVNKIHVESAEQARELRFVSSPTIRVNGRDVALDLRENSGGSECDEEHTEPPLAMITNAILREAYGSSAVKGEPAAEEPAAACCPPSEQRTCCDPDDKAGCCGSSTGVMCGCQ